MVIQLFYATGMRLSELIQCKQNNVDLGKKQIKVLGKGNKERILPISAELALELKNTYNKNLPKPKGFLIYLSLKKGNHYNPEPYILL